MRQIALVILFGGFLTSLHAFGEMTVQNYIKNMSPINITDKGGVMIPPPVYQAIAAGKVSDVQQFSYERHIMMSCAKKIIEEPMPDRMTHAFKKARWENIKCRMSRCHQQAMIISILPYLAGGSTGSGGAGGLMAQVLTGTEQNSCTGSGAAFDQGLVNFVKAKLK